MKHTLPVVCMTRKSILLRWADNVARRKKDTRQKVVNAEFFEGGTIGPVTAEKVPTRFTARP